MSRKGDDDARSVPVNIFGQEYTLRTEDEAAYVESLAAYVDGRMREVADKTRTADTVKIAILAALNIADDLHRQQRDSDDARRDLRERTGRIVDLLDAALAG